MERKCGADYASSRTGWGWVYEAEWEHGWGWEWRISCRVYEQDRKLSRVQRQDREQEEADNKADQGCSVTPPKDEESIPSTHCDTRPSSVQHRYPRHVNLVDGNET